MSIKRYKERKDSIYKCKKKKKVKQRIRNKHNQNVQDLYEGNLKILLRETNEDLNKYLELYSWVGNSMSYIITTNIY